MIRSNATGSNFTLSFPLAYVTLSLESVSENSFPPSAGKQFSNTL